MMTKTEAIVLHSIKYGERKLIVDMFTREQGRLSFAVPLSSSAKSKIKKQYFQPLTLLQIECDVNPRRDLQRLTEVSLSAPLFSLYADPSKLAVALFVAEFLCHALRSEQHNAPLFAYLSSAVVWLDGCESSVANFHLALLIHLSRFLGFYPNIDDYTEGCLFDLRSASFCMDHPVHRDVLLPDEAALIRTMMRMDLPTMHLFRFTRSQRQRCLDVMMQYYRLHLPNFPELHSLEVLRETWD